MFFSVNAQLNGIKTIGGSSPDYATLGDAVSALNSQGVNGPVVFNIRSGTYNEQISLTPITGTSSINTITFQSEAENVDSVIIKYAATGNSDNYVIELDGADFITIQKLTLQSQGTDYGNVIDLGSYTTGISIIDNHIIGVSTTDFDIMNRALIAYIGVTGSTNRFHNNILENGYTGIYCYDFNNTDGPEISNNRFLNQYYQGIYVWQITTVITGNEISTNSLDQNYTGINISYCVDTFIVKNNTIEKSNNQGGCGIGIYNCTGSSGREGLVANNMIHIHSKWFSSVGISSNQNTSVKIYHNTVNLTGTSSGSKAIHIINDHSGLDVRNNIFNNQSGGYTYYVESITGLILDFNDLSTTGPNFGYWANDIPDFDSWKTTSGQDANSISVDPLFWSDSDLHSANTDLKSGTPLLSDVGNDFDGEPRDSYNPCMGADEFVHPALGGTYSIGTTGDYQSFSEAVRALVDGGVRKAVVFNVDNGTYSEQITIPFIENTSDENTICFQSSSGDSSSVILTYSPSGEGDNYTVRLEGVQHLRFMGLTFQSVGSDSATVFNLIEGAGNLEFLNNQIIGSTSETLASGSLITGEDNWVGNHVVVKHNLFINGDRGLVLYGDFSENYGGYIIENNTFKNQSLSGITIMGSAAPRVTGNEITSNSNGDFVGIGFVYCDSNIVAEKNKIRASDCQGGNGIVLARCNSLSGNPAILSNNFIRLNSNPTGTVAAGCLIYETDYVKIFNNTIILTGDLISSMTIYLMVYYDNIDFTNNILVNQAGGYVVYSDITSGVVLDYNDLYTNGPALGYWDAADQSNMSAWQSASGQDANSLSVDPAFGSGDELHFPNPLLNNVGTPVSEVVDDIDGEMRDPASPDIGADEFCLPPAAENKFGCTNRVIPDLEATGNYITWYGDGALTNPLSTGNSFATGQTSAGNHMYYLTQTINESESQADTVTLTINVTPAKPSTSDSAVCFGDPTPDIMATGTDLKWYSDVGLTTQVGTGSSYNPGITDTGTYPFYVTQSLKGCESNPETAVLTVHSIPPPPEGALFTSCFGDIVPDLTATGENIRWYSDGALNNLIHSGSTFSSGNTLAGTYLYYTTQTINSCESGSAYDTLRINPNPTIGITTNQNTIDQGSSTNLNATGADDYQWSPSTGLSKTTGNQVAASPTENTTYFLEGTNQDGCKGHDSIDLFVYCPACEGQKTFFTETGTFKYGCTNNVYKNNLECSWTILPSGVDSIHLKFTSPFDIRTGDFVRIYNGENALSESLIGEYNNDNLPPVIISSGNSMFIQFITDDHGTAGLGFQARWSNNPVFIGVKDPSGDRINIYPNPAQDKLYIEFNNLSNEDFKLYIYNHLGQMIMNQNFDNSGGQTREEVDISDIKSGLHIVRILHGNHVINQKFIKE
ncbi:CUB domain-containing protein [Bacteroidota bacterium]